MQYDQQLWNLRYQSRIDITASLTHLTRSVVKKDETIRALDILIKILGERKIRPSTTSSGFIIGDIPAVCFMEAPLYSICQNIDFERELKKKELSNKIRYAPFGLMFRKNYVFDKGGRPVFYEKNSIAKKLLPSDEWWRIVNFDLSDKNNIIDWTHEREWRAPNSFKFDLSEVTVLVPNDSVYKEFYKKVSLECKDILDEIKCVTSLGSFYL